MRLFFLALMALFLVYPYLAFDLYGRMVLAVLYSGVPLAGVFAVPAGRHARGVAAAGAAAIATLTALNLFVLAEPWVLLFWATVIAFLAWITVVLLSYLFGPGEVSADRLYAAASVYLLLGISWFAGYCILEHLQPGSFDGLAESGEAGHYPELMYYSFVTLTTLGYGEITPVTPPARSLSVTEAVVGVLYGAILVARLVGMYRPSDGPERR